MKNAKKPKDSRKMSKSKQMSRKQKQMFSFDNISSSMLRWKTIAFVWKENMNASILWVIIPNKLLVLIVLLRYLII